MTTTVTATAPAVSSLIVDTVTTEPTVTAVDVATSVTTVVDTITDYTTLVFTTTDVEQSLVTVTATEIVTTHPITITLTVDKRSLATSVPGYASACDGPEGYASACLCAGIVGATTTITVPKLVQTVTKTLTTTPTVLATTTAIATLPTTLVETSILPATETALTTVFDEISTTVVQTTIVPSTTTATVQVTPSCTAFFLQVSSSFINGAYMVNSQGQISASSLESQALLFELDPDNGYLVVVGTTTQLALVPPTSDGNPTTISPVDESDATIPLICSFPAGESLSSMPEISCEDSIGYDQFNFCMLAGSAVWMSSPGPAAVNGNCVSLTFVAVPQC